MPLSTALPSSFLLLARARAVSPTPNSLTLLQDAPVVGLLLSKYMYYIVSGYNVDWDKQKINLSYIHEEIISEGPCCKRSES